ncbi:MAG: sulfatase family protein, partial [Solirubrobacterales bacterium]
RIVASGGPSAERSTRRRALMLAAALVVVVVAAGEVGAGGTHPSAAGGAAGGSAPNIVVIESDDQTVEAMRVMDNVNSLIGAHGVTFANSFVNYSLCCPSRATFLTGQYEHNHKVASNQWPNGGFPRFEQLHAYNNLAVWLHKAGYYTALIGKYLNAYKDDPPVPPGWSEWHAAPEGYGVYGYVLNNNGTLVHYGTAPTDFKQDVLTGKAVNLIERRAPKPNPFFLWLTYTAPHWSPPDPNPNPPSNCRHAAKPAPRDAHAFDDEPLPTPPNFNERRIADKPKAIRDQPLLSQGQIDDIRRGYRCELESLLSVDRGVRQVVDALEASGELDQTLIVYTSDNGYFHGEHRIPKDKQHVYEESIRVPLEMRGPGVPQGETVNDLVINADLAPTVVDASGAVPELTMDGTSLLPVAATPGVEKGRALLIEEPTFEAIRTAGFMYAEHDTGERELYNLKTDPFELTNRAGDPSYASIEAGLATRLHDLETCEGATCRALQSGPGSG